MQNNSPAFLKRKNVASFMVYGHKHGQAPSCSWIQRDVQSFCMNLIARSGPQHEHGTIIQTFYFIIEMNKLLKSRIDSLFVNSLRKALQ